MISRAFAVYWLTNDSKGVYERGHPEVSNRQVHDQSVAAFPQILQFYEKATGVVIGRIAMSL